MSEVDAGYCPACQKEVVYEVDDGDIICPDCGRTQKAGEIAAKIFKSQKRRRRFKLAMKVVGGLVIVLLMVFGLLIDPERLIDKGVKTAKGIIIPLGIIAVIGFIIALVLKRLKKPKEIEEINKEQTD